MANLQIFFSMCLAFLFFLVASCKCGQEEQRVFPSCWLADDESPNSKPRVVLLAGVSILFCGFIPMVVTAVDINLQGEVVRIHGDKFWYMTRVLCLGINDRVELFDGAGGLVQGSIQKVDKNGSDVELLENARLISPQGIQWHVFAAFGPLKGGRADWLIEKCTELGASSVMPLLTERCHTIAENRVDRLQRLVLAAVKQCQRVHDMSLKPPIQIHDLPVVVEQSKLDFLASAEAPPVLSILPKSSSEKNGLLIIGPEGDFTEEEVNVLKAAGVVPVGLGPCRLRVETATISFLSALMPWSDVGQQERQQCR